MNFYYDIIVNFQENNYMFYEWEDDDVLDCIKKIPLIQVTTKTLKDLVNNNFMVDKEFLTSIHKKTKLKNGTLEYAALFASKNGALVVEFAQDGSSIARSYLQVIDECHIQDILYTLPTDKLNYKIINKIIENKGIRKEEIIKKFINLELNTLYKNKDLEKIVFLYNEWFLKTKSNVAEMIHDMQNKLKSGITDVEVKIYELIKLSYSNV